VSILLALAAKAAGALYLLAAALLIGTAAFDFLVWRRTGLPIGPVRTAAEHEMADLVLASGRWSAVAVLLLAVPRAIDASLLLNDRFSLWTRFDLLVFRTEWGLGLLAVLVAGILSLLGYAWAARHRRGGWPLIWTGVLCVGIGAGLQGHPDEVFAKVTITPILDGIHALGVGGWLGTFFLLVVAERRLPAHTSSPWTDPLGAMLGRYFKVSGSLAALVLITGLLSASMHLTSFEDIRSTEYGRLLAGKVGIVVILLILNEHHRRHAERQARTAERPQLAHSLRFEAGLIGLILCLSALLIDVTPPGVNEVHAELFRAAPRNAVQANDIPLER
jgi:putative copper export protein